MEKLKSNKKIAFSLAESLISMMLLVFAIMLTMTSITKKKFQSETKMRTGGMYACWNNGRLHYSYYDGNKERERETNNNAEKCIFNMDRRIDNYHIIAVGSRKCTSDGECVDGQVSEYATGKPDSNNLSMEIQLGDFNDKPEQTETTVKYTNTTQNLVSALGNTSPTESKLAEGNIKKCKFVGGSPCGADEPECIVVAKATNGSFPIKCKNGNDSQTKCNLLLRENISGGKVLKEVNDSEKTYTGDCIDDQNSEYKVTIKVQEYDSMFKASVNNDTKKSPFVNYLKTFPASRQNGLTDKLLNYYQKDNGERNGVVLIFW